MSEVGSPSVGAFHCSFALVIPSKFGFGGGVGPTASSASGDFLLLLGRSCTLVSVPLWAWGAVAAVFMVLAGPRRSPTGDPTGEPRAATCVFAVVVAALTPFPTWPLTGRPSNVTRGLVPPNHPKVDPPANALGLAQVGSGCSLVVRFHSFVG
jgi:hypothetical protein